MMMDARRAFLDKITEFPDDDTPRLVYADWLEEKGQADRAEFIRVQCELAKLPTDPPLEGGSCRVDGWSSVRPQASHMNLCQWCQWMRDGTFARIDLLHRLEQSSLDQSKSEAMRPFSFGDEREEGRIEPPHGISFGPSHITVHLGWEHEAAVFMKFRRGFAEEIRCELATWLTHGSAICREQPVRPHSEMITDREPMGLFVSGFVWVEETDPQWERGPWSLPSEVYSRLDETESTDRDGAMMALARACIMGARSLNRS